MRTQQIAVWAAVGVATALLAGCQVDSHKTGNSENVKVQTPFGGVQVKTNDADVLESLGLPAYPGAAPVKKNDKDSGAADVNMNFGSFRLRVKAVSYRTTDAPDKVEDFYRNGMKRYGEVITCRGGKVVGSPAETPEGLSCDSQVKNHISVDDKPGPDHLQLKAGSTQHQHIVAIDKDGGGAKFSLVALDLPGKMGVESDDTRQ